ncbi:hypothetical protein D3C86_2015470 [compost metagenome]
MSIFSSDADVLSKVLEAGLAGKLTIVTYDQNGGEKATKLNLSDEKFKNQVAKMRTIIDDLRKEKEVKKN